MTAATSNIVCVLRFAADCRPRLVLRASCLDGHWQPAPVHVHDPAGQFVNEQVDPCAHAMTHPPAEQSTLHVAPAGHEVLQ
jgi:hypothetical protein